MLERVEGTKVAQGDLLTLPSSTNVQVRILAGSLSECTQTVLGEFIYVCILYYTILYYTILYYTILYYTILYYTILYSTLLTYFQGAYQRTHNLIEGTTAGQGQIPDLTCDLARLNMHTRSPVGSSVWIVYTRVYLRMYVQMG